MSKIKIICIKYAEAKEKKGKDLEDYHGKVSFKAEKDNSIKLEISSSQLFMNTEKFFETAKKSLEKYFDEIAKKID